MSSLDFGLALPRVPWLSEQTSTEDMRPHRVHFLHLPRRFRVKLRNTRTSRYFPLFRRYILGDRLARLSSGGRECFHSISNKASALPAPEQADKVLRSPCRLETGKFSTYSLSTTISRLRMNGRFAAKSGRWSMTRFGVRSARPRVTPKTFLEAFLETRHKNGLPVPGRRGPPLTT